MAEADLDVVIRQLAKSQTKSLTEAVKKRRDAFLALAAKTADKDKKARFKQLAKDAMLYGTAAARRLQTSADNAADSYARSMRNAAEALTAKKPEAAPAKKSEKKPEAAPPKKPVKKPVKKTAKTKKKAA